MKFEKRSSQNVKNEVWEIKVVKFEKQIVEIWVLEEKNFRNN